MENERLVSPTLDSTTTSPDDTTADDNTTHEFTTPIYGLGENCKEIMGRKLFDGNACLSSATSEDPPPPLKMSALLTPATTEGVSEERTQEMTKLEMSAASPVIEISTTQLGENCKEFMGRKLFDGNACLSSVIIEEAPTVNMSALLTPATTEGVFEENTQDMTKLEMSSPVIEIDTSTSQIWAKCKEIMDRKLFDGNGCLSSATSEYAPTPTTEGVSEEGIQEMPKLEMSSPSVIEISTTQLGENSKEFMGRNLFDGNACLSSVIIEEAPTVNMSALLTPSTTEGKIVANHKEDVGDVAEVVSMMAPPKETVVVHGNNSSQINVKVVEERMMTPIKEVEKSEKVREEQLSDINKTEDRVEEEPTTQSAPFSEPLRNSYEIKVVEERTPIKEVEKIEKVREQQEPDINKTEESTRVEDDPTITTTPSAPFSEPVNIRLTYCWEENEENTNEQDKASTQPSSSSAPPSTSTNQFTLPPPLNFELTEDVVEVKDFEAKSSTSSGPLSPLPEASNLHSEPMPIVTVQQLLQTTVDILKGTPEPPAENSPRRSKRMKKINKKMQTPKNRSTPMGLPKPNRLKKRQFSVQEIYTNKNYHTPKPKAWETIFEEPKIDKKGQVKFLDKRTRKRTIQFYTQPSDRPAKKRDRECSKELRKKANQRKKMRIEFGISEESVRSRLNEISDDDDEEPPLPMLSLS